MSDYWGVTCKTCNEFVKLGVQQTEAMITYDPSLHDLPVPCSECGASHLYGTADVVDEDGGKLD